MEYDIDEYEATSMLMIIWGIIIAIIFGVSTFKFVSTNNIYTSFITFIIQFIPYLIVKALLKVKYKSIGEDQYE